MSDIETKIVVAKSAAENLNLEEQRKPSSSAGSEAALLTGFQDRHYPFGLAMALVSSGVCLDIIGSDETDSPELHMNPNLHFLNFRSKWTHDATFRHKLAKLLAYYVKLIGYVAHCKPKILHILWNNNLELFDRTVLMLYYKLLGKKIILTAHNVNKARRDGKDSWLNRTTLNIQYQLCDRIFVHTQEMKRELCHEFGVAEKGITVIRYPINNAIPETELTPVDAKRRLGIREDDRTILFFGAIVPYKGIEYLLDAFRLLLVRKQANYRLIIAGEPKKGSEAYLREIEKFVEMNCDGGQVILKLEFIPDDEVEFYLKGADVLVLPYKEIFQSGVLFLAYSFGLPVVAADVGSLREDIIEGSTGFVCKPGNATELANTIETYFASELYRNLAVRRSEIRQHANSTHSWDAVAELTRSAYSEILRSNTS
jgi:D-inositol-3-phosphate glycosyltransferase